MRRHATILVATVVCLLAGAGTAGAGGGGHSVCAGFGEGQQVAMLDSCFEGIGHVVTAGEAIQVVNAGRADHTFTAVDGSFDSGRIAAGDTFEITLDEAGAVPIYCTLHGTRDGAGMAGLLVVQSSSLAGAEPAAAEMSRAPLWSAAAIVVAALAFVAVRRRTRGRTTVGS